MGFNLNKISLIGTLGKDIEVTFTTSNLEIGKFSITTNDSIKKNDQWEDETTWHNCIIFKPSEFLKKQLVKGAKVYLEGKQQHKSYEKDGVKKYYSDVLVNPYSVIPLSNRSNSDNLGVTPVDNDVPGSSGLPF